MENEISIIEVIGGIISIVTLIVFFNMAWNIGKIKNILSDMRYGQIKQKGSTKVIRETDPWECPNCKHENPNTSYTCEKCKYSII